MIKTKIKSLTNADGKPLAKGVVICDVEGTKDAVCSYPINVVPEVGETVYVKQDGDIFWAKPEDEPAPATKPPKPPKDS